MVDTVEDLSDKDDLIESDDLFLTDTIAGEDGLKNPFYAKHGKWNLNPDGGSDNDNSIADGGIFTPADQLIDPEELYIASFTPKGSYITRVSNKFTFYQGWKHVKSILNNEPLTPLLAKKLHDIDVNYQMKKKITMMSRTGDIFGRALVFLQNKPKWFGSRKVKTVLRVSPIFENDIDYSEPNELGESYPIMFHPQVRAGKSRIRLDIPPEKAVLYIPDEDENGNMFQGIPALLSSYETICRDESISEDYATTMAERGLGFIDIEDTQAKTLGDLKKVRKAFNLGRDRMFIHGPRYKAEARAGIQSGLNFDESKARFTKDVSSATGYPGMAMEGVQVGAVTGSETDQDNRAQMYRTKQETIEMAIYQLYYLIDPGLEDKDFELEWEFEVKEDRSKKAQVMATFGGAINQVQDLITVNQSLHLLQLPLMKNEEDGKQLLSHWIAENSPMIETVPNEPNKENNDFPEKEEKVDVKEGEPVENKDNVESDSIKATKESICRRMLDNGHSYKDINTLLSVVFDSGLSNTTIQEIRGEIK